MIYFIRSPTGLIKIGTSSQLSKRVRQLASAHGHRLEVLAVLNGSRSGERIVHRRFAHLRQLGEWFEPADDLMEFISSEGRPWDGSDEVERYRVRITHEAYEVVRIVAAYTGETITNCLNRLIVTYGTLELQRLKAAAAQSCRQPEATLLEHAI